MKRFVFLLFVFALVSCGEKMETTGFTTNGLYLDNELVCPVRTGFSGGSLSNPAAGVVYRLHFYGDAMGADPRHALVFMAFSELQREDYPNYAKTLGGIRITFPEEVPGLDRSLSILFDRGEYFGSSEDVSGVSIRDFSYRDYADKWMIDIEFKLKDKRTLRFFYYGTTPRDGMF